MDAHWTKLLPTTMLLDFDNVVDGLVIVGAKNHWKKYGQTRETNNNELISGTK